MYSEFMIYMYVNVKGNTKLLKLSNCSVKETKKVTSACKYMTKK